MKVFNLILFIFRYIQLTKGKYIYKAADFVRANVKVLNVAHVLKMFTLSEFMLPSNLLSFYIKRYNNVPHVQFELCFFSVCYSAKNRHLSHWKRLNIWILCNCTFLKKNWYFTLTTKKADLNFSTELDIITCSVDVSPETC